MNDTIVERLHKNIVYVSLKNVYNTSHECDDLIAKLQRVYDDYIQSRERFIFVFNTERVNYCQPILLRRFAEWMSSKRQLNEQFLICSYIVITNVFTRTCLNTIVGIFKPTKPYLVRESTTQVNKELPNVLKHEGLV
jgi:hypothetical protein